MTERFISINRRDDFPCILWGGTNDGRAKVILSDNSPEFSDPKNPKPVISTKTDANPNITFNVMIISLDVDLGKGNAGGIGIDHQGAQRMGRPEFTCCFALPGGHG